MHPRTTFRADGMKARGGITSPALQAAHAQGQRGLLRSPRVALSGIGVPQGKEAPGVPGFRTQLQAPLEDGASSRARVSSRDSCMAPLHKCL